MPTLHHLMIILKQEVLNIVNIAILETQGFINENPLPEKLANATPIILLRYVGLAQRQAILVALG